MWNNVNNINCGISLQLKGIQIDDVKNIKNIINLVCFVVQSQEISTKFMSGNVIFTWPSSGNSSVYDVIITRNTTKDPTKRITVPEYIVKNATLYHSIGISMYYLKPNVREIRSAYNGIWSLFLFLMFNS